MVIRFESQEQAAKFRALAPVEPWETRVEVLVTVLFDEETQHLFQEVGDLAKECGGEVQE